MATELALKRRHLPKLMACMTKNSLENMRNKALFNMEVLDARQIRRERLALHECLILELRESGYFESSEYIQDLIYDNMQLIADDEIGIVVDLRKRKDYLEHVCAGVQRAERERDRDETKKECLELLDLAMYYANKEKGLLWLPEKLFLSCMAVSSKYLVDGGRLKAVCKFHYAKFLLDKFPGADPDEPSEILSEVRDCSSGKSWPLYESQDMEEEEPSITVFVASAIELHSVLLKKARAIRNSDPAKAERLGRLAERRARDANHELKTAEAVIEMGICQLTMNNLNNALRSLQRAFKINTKVNNIEGLCDTRMHLAAVLQRLGDHEGAAEMLTEMGALAMEHDLRRHLGRALHLLGELHLRREKPELGTQHLAEAFQCFMGFNYETDLHRNSQPSIINPVHPHLEVIIKADDRVVYMEEAEQSRLMMAVSAGQELMSSYFNLIRQGGTCAVARMKHIQWKLAQVGWWSDFEDQENLACPCPLHNRTLIDILRNKLAKLEARRLSNVVELATDNSSSRDEQLNIQKETTEEPSRKARVHIEV